MLTAWKDENSGVIVMTDGKPPKISFFDVSPENSKKLERKKCNWVVYEELKEKLEGK
jgi:hypothetical protein